MRVTTIKRRGRKLKYGEQTKILTFRVPRSISETVKDAVKYIISNRELINKTHEYEQ